MPNPARAAEASSLLARLADQSEAPKYIRAYHGSPYDFDRFDASKIGTGEGAQAYGHGLYFAGNPEVANAYRRKLSEQPGAGVVLYYDDAGLRLPTDLVYKLEDDRFANKWGPDGAPDAARRIAAELRQKADEMRGRGLGGYEVSWWQQSADQLERFADSGLRPAGRTYEVEIGHPEDALLDWDRPLKSQSGLVGERLAPFRTDQYDLSPARDTDYETGATALYRIAGAFDSDMAEAASALRKAGIPGIRYLDHGSRSIGEGTRNYVIFPGAEDSIRILRKYAVPGAIGTGAAAMQEQ